MKEGLCEEKSRKCSNKLSQRNRRDDENSMSPTPCKGRRVLEGGEDEGEKGGKIIQQQQICLSSLKHHNILKTVQ